MIPSYIIHLPDSTDREPVIAEMHTLLPGAQMVEAVDGRAMSQAERDAVTAAHLHHPAYPFALLPAEVGCFLSHRKCWQMIAEGPEDFGMIAEDDILFDPNLSPAAISLAAEHCSPTRFVRFPLSDRETARQTLDRSGEAHLYRPALAGLGATLQIVGRDLAARLVNMTESFDRPVDTFLQMTWLTGADVLSVYPNGQSTVDYSHGGSTIQQPKPLLEKLPREWKRWRYRRQIRALAAAEQKKHEKEILTP